MTTYHLGLVGLGVMGANLARNLAGHGFSVAGYARSADTRAAFDALAAPELLRSFADVPTFVGALERPRRILLLVPAKAVDEVIASLRPYLERGDLLVDLGNSFFEDTERRAAALEQDGILFLGSGVSGGEKGALLGPSIMPGGQREAYQLIAPVFEAIAARVDGTPCVAYIGPRGAGHYVKMVHNGIEYGIMQLIAEAYDLLKRVVGATPDELQRIFRAWKEGELNSYLIEITTAIFGTVDPESGQPLVELILDEAEQKGTGKWTSQNALDLGVPTHTINAAVEGRLISALREERLAAQKVLAGPAFVFSGDRVAFIEQVRQALYAGIVCSYAQGFALLRAASREYDYALNLAEIATIWRGGCIIRAALLQDIRAAYAAQPELPNLLVAEPFRSALLERQEGWRSAVRTGIAAGIPVPALAASLAYFDAYRAGRLPANLTQAQRDYFGAHTYRRVDKEGVFHTHWE